MFFEVVKNPSLAANYAEFVPNDNTAIMPFHGDAAATISGNTPYILHPQENQKVDILHPIEESLNLADTEKEFIIKALKKHRGRRRDAASELGISERTLYRKIKEYDIDE